MTRLSFNAMVSRKKYDMPEDMFKTTTMGRQAEWGKDFCTNPIMARTMSGHLDPTRPDCFSPIKSFRQTGEWLQGSISPSSPKFVARHATLNKSPNSTITSWNGTWKELEDRRSVQNRMGSTDGSHASSRGGLTTSWSSPML
eukprot:CAMPEP_0115065276 /NCGR_PEP_ID=MMETSP0227-20121206/10159_1 /TAXON_ID=89957 /ORGANISM="Polarella glacialis, Strain CCMP 1383" /LENGTH=141 /DNA_ID=CAMNT_0002451043 /DNA_START=104 /DNA_END=529 /DNA_ORIENTATION=+